MSDYFLFSDASLNPQLKIGVGGYLVVPESYITTPLNLIKKSELDEMIVLRKFRETSSTKLEIQTVLWALEEYCNASAISNSKKLHIYSDSQCVAGLLSRKRLLERNDFHSRRGNRLLKNASLYVKYYQFHDRLKFKVVKVPGHTRTHSHNTIQRIFSFVDQKVRKTLKLWVTRIETEKDEWSLYMIRCCDGSLYTGISNDVAKRFEKHQEMGRQGAKYLRGRGPLELVFQKKIGNKSSALKMEIKIKKLSKSQKENIIREYESKADLTSSFDGIQQI